MSTTAGADLTERQREVLDFIRLYITTHSWPPTRVEIADALQVYPHAITEHLAALQRKGWIEVVPHTARGIRVLGE